MKICVVDDEREVRLSIIYKLETLFPHAQVFDVEFGHLALEQLNIVRPDLVFMDIRMPEMDGLDILRSIKITFPSVQVVVLSGYDDFEYARKALQLGAINYLLKPADREQLREIVEKVEQDMRAAFMKEMEEYLGKLSAQYIFVHDIRCFNTSLWVDDRQLKEIRFGDAASMLEEYKVAPNEIVITFSVNNDFGVIVTGTASAGHNELHFYDKNDFLPELVSGIEKWESRRYFGGLRNLSANTKRNQKEAAKQATHLRQEILSAARTGKFDLLQSLLHAWFDYLQDMEFNQLRKECVNLMAMLDEGLSKNEIIVLKEEKIQYWWNWVAKFKTWNEMRDKIRKFVLEGVSALKQLESQSNLNWFEQALHMVDTSHGSNLSLEYVAEVVGVHPVTLSRVFKQQTGINFVRYIVQCRLREAQVLLLKTDKKINEISEEVGYADYRYFRTLFKKEFGLTPSEYRRSNGIATSTDEM